MDSLAEAERLLLNGEPRRAAEAARRARMFARRHDDDGGEARALMLLGQALAQAGDHKPAVEALVEARAKWAGLPDQRHEAEALIALAELSPDEATADSYLDSARRLARAAGVVRLEGDALLAWGERAAARGDEDIALERLSEARERFERSESVLRLGLTLSRLANLEARLGHADRAHEALETAIGLFEDSGDLLDEADARRQLGRLLAGMGDRDGARDALSAAVRRFAAGGDLEGEGACLLDLGRLEAKAAPGQAGRHLRHAAELFRRAGNAALGAEAQKAMALLPAE
ncbi:hypothetical protein SAMN05421742_105244 [Roseospirillum parvum]|uniref:Tetratricopeptide repeat-containing protein n=1 Tax=Roseospirillum parvum TaxID=83401 RepID=A0A1G8B6J2_9PROT|nr:hypothetical protein SAMN05421742_105244 [Roseospirillum parvum]